MASDDFDGITTDQLVKGNPDVAAAVQGAGRELAAALRPTGNDGCQPCPPDVVAAGAPSSIDRLAQADAMKERLNTGTVAAQLATLGGAGAMIYGCCWDQGRISPLDPNSPITPLTKDLILPGLPLFQICRRTRRVRMLIFSACKWVLVFGCCNRFFAQNPQYPILFNAFLTLIWYFVSTSECN